MKSIEALGRDLTLLLVAHRLSTLRVCDLVLDVGEHGVRRVEPDVRVG
jgi:ABC-type multidrug transport system fused ATPase/permease subunit